MAWDSNLNPQSPAYQIAVDNSRYIRVLAGPGTGKSFALKRRVARLLEDGIAPTRILPVTFTKVAAEDLQRELLNMGAPGCEQIRGSTLHSFGMRVLSLQNVLAVTGRVARPLNRFEMEPLLYDLPTSFGKKRSGKSAFAPTKRPGHACSMNSPVLRRSRPTSPFRMHLSRGCGFTRAC
jgi:DNA helicase II / ATP-dependent DNA helicase PcrA